MWPLNTPSAPRANFGGNAFMAQLYLKWKYSRSDEIYTNKTPKEWVNEQLDSAQPSSKTSGENEKAQLKAWKTKYIEEAKNECKDQIHHQSHHPTTWLPTIPLTSQPPYAPNNASSPPHSTPSSHAVSPAPGTAVQYSNR